MLSLMSALQQQPLTPVREGKAEAYLSRLAIGAAVAEGPIPFGSRVASPEPEEQQLQPESSAAASSRAAPAVAAEPAAAEAAPVAAAEAPAPAAVVAEPPQPAGGVAGGGQAAGRGGQAAGRPALFGTGRHAAQRGDLREAVRRVQQAADDQARRDRELYGNARWAWIDGGCVCSSKLTLTLLVYLLWLITCCSCHGCMLSSPCTTVSCRYAAAGYGCGAWAARAAAAPHRWRAVRTAGPSCPAGSTEQPTGGGEQRYLEPHLCGRQRHRVPWRQQQQAGRASPAASVSGGGTATG